MRKSLAGGVCAAAAFVVVFGSGSASGIGEYNGMTYGKAVESASSWGGTITIATREGSYLPTDQCMIVGTRKAGFLDSSGRSQGGYRYLVDLNCNDTTAMNGHPGNSLATPEGQKAFKLSKQGTALSEQYDKEVADGKPPACGQSEGTMKWCADVCQRSGSCSSELTDYLGM